MLTAKERKCYDFVAATLTKDRVAPSYDEIMQYMGLRSKSGVHRIIQSVASKGYLYTIPGRARAISLAPQNASDEMAIALLNILKVSRLKPTRSKNKSVLLSEIYEIAADVLFKE